MYTFQIASHPPFSLWFGVTPVLRSVSTVSTSRCKWKDPFWSVGPGFSKDDTTPKCVSQLPACKRDQKETGGRSLPCLLPFKACYRMFAHFLEKSSVLGKYGCCLAIVLLFLLLLSLFWFFISQLKNQPFNSSFSFYFLKD